MYLATFYTHLGAMEMHERLQSLGDATAQMLPVPRKLSVSCGTGLRFSLPFDAVTMQVEDLEAVFLEEAPGQYKKLWSAEADLL